MSYLGPPPGLALWIGTASANPRAVRASADAMPLRGVAGVIGNRSSALQRAPSVMPNQYALTRGSIPGFGVGSASAKATAHSPAFAGAARTS
jgi:hypothetical protein